MARVHALFQRAEDDPQLLARPAHDAGRRDLSIGPARPVGAGAQRAAWLATTYHAASLAGARAAGWLAQAIEAIPEAVSMVGGSIYWSMLPEGTHLKSHCGPSNTRSAAPPYPHRDWAHPFHICAGTGLTPATSAPGRRSAK